MKLTLDTIATSAVAIAALIAAAVAVHREFGGGPITMRAQAARPHFVAAWRDAERVGTPVSNPGAKVLIVEIGDFECPYCRQFYTNLKVVTQRFGKDVGLVFVNYPLSYHRFARPAAKAANCADQQGAFGGFYAALYEKQDSLGLRPWTAYATDAGVKDTTRFAQCIHEDAPVPKIDSGVAWGKRLEVHGTPTLIVNGWMYSSLPADSLQAVVGRAIAGVAPGIRP